MVSSRVGVPLESGPAAIRVEVWLSLPPVGEGDGNQASPAALEVFQGQDWDKWLEDYSPNVGSARILRVEREPVTEEFELEGWHRVVYTLDLFSEWELDPEEFEYRMSYDWAEGTLCASCELIPPVHPPNIPLVGDASKVLLSVGDNGSLSGWQLVGSGIPATREATRLIRASLGPVLDWMEAAEDEVWFAAITDPIVAETSGLGHEYPYWIGIVPDLQPTMKVAGKRFRDVGVEPEELAAHYRREALAALLCKVAELNAEHGPPREHSHADRVMVWPLVNFGPAWRLESQLDALDGIQRFLDRSTGGLETISLRQQRTQPFEFEMDAATVASLLEKDEEGSRFPATFPGPVRPTEAEEVSPREVGCPDVSGLRLWRLAQPTD